MFPRYYIRSEYVTDWNLHLHYIMRKRMWSSAWYNRMHRWIWSGRFPIVLVQFPAPVYSKTVLDRKKSYPIRSSYERFISLWVHTRLRSKNSIKRFTNRPFRLFGYIICWRRRVLYSRDFNQNAINHPKRQCYRNITDPNHKKRMVDLIANKDTESIWLQYISFIVFYLLKKISL